MHLSVSEAKEVPKGDDKKTKAQCYEELRAAAKAEYGKGCDLPTVTLNVDFINCADTEEYRDYHLLQNIYLGDAVRVIAPRIGVAVSMRLTQYTYDCLKRKYTQLSLGSVAETLEGNMISARQLLSGSITGGKLASNSVGSLQLKAASIQAGHIDADAITTDKLAAGVVTAEKLAAGAVDAGALSAITAKIGSHGYSAKLYRSAAHSPATSSDTVTTLNATIAQMLSGITDSTSAITTTFSNGSDWSFLLVVTNGYETRSASASIPRAFANLHLSGCSTGGACFGGFSKSAEGAPMLESYYPAYLYGGIALANGGVEELVLPFDDGAIFKLREDNPLQPTLRRFGHVIELHGEIQPTQSISGSTTYYPICTLPAEYAPHHEVIVPFLYSSARRPRSPPGWRRGLPCPQDLRRKHHSPGSSARVRQL